ncbi:hypothetical protein EO087_09095 [Dyella sp. M7H15-1]|uniref:hypothetical protein n=1 Tax=Dyella sp. M7H15-1 TaxID=2501295 RepID=UPI001004FCD3|nr:hypothetical protein [Dyella sp. M7H15-1]QAU24127.1 hypothetical protein EO087_09095 [Dyella sp. M7H15-1]
MSHEEIDASETTVSEIVVATQTSAKAPARVGSVPLWSTRYGILQTRKSDDVVTRSLSKYGEWMEQELDVIGMLLDEGSVALQYGAEYGVHTLYLSALVGDSGQVHVAEPRRLEHIALCNAVGLNNLRNVYPHHVGLGERSGKLELASSNDQPEERTHMVAVDSLELPNLHLLKVNAPGTLISVLAGAVEALRQHKPAIYFRLSTMELAVTEIETLKAHGYRCWSHLPYLYNSANLSGNKLNIFPGWTHQNVIATRQPSLDTCQNSERARAMGHCDNTRQCPESDKARPKSSRFLLYIPILIVAAFSIGIAACVVPPASSARKQTDQHSELPQVAAWRDDDIASLHSPFASEQTGWRPADTQTEVDDESHSVASGAANTADPAARHVANTLAEAPVETASNNGSADSSSPAFVTSSPGEPMAANVSAPGQQRALTSYATPASEERITPVVTRTSYVLLTLMFLIGLALGVLLSVVLLKRHKRMANLPSASRERHVDPFTTSEWTLTDPDERDISQHPSVDTVVASRDDSIAPVTEPIPDDSAGTQHVLDIDLVIDMKPLAFDAMPVSSTRAENHGHSPARDLRRATVLLEQGEPEQALAIIEPYLQEKGLNGEPQISMCAEQWHPFVDVYYLDHPHPAPLELAELHADIRWQMIHLNRHGADYAAAARALEAYLAITPEAAIARLRLGHCLIAQVDRELDEIAQGMLLQSCINALNGFDMTNNAMRLIQLGMLGDAMSRHALLEPTVDANAIAEAENVLREALAMDATEDSGVAWSLQKLLGAEIPGMTAAEISSRLQECIVILRLGLAACVGTPDRPRWQAALLRAELKEVHYTHPNVAARRLRLRELHADYAEMMSCEQSPDVLTAWVELLCAMAEPLVGSAARERYDEVDQVLGRLIESDSADSLYAMAWIKMVNGRLSIESESGKRDLLERTTAVLEPRLDMASDTLRLQASKLALQQAELAEGPVEQGSAYARALKLARPLTAVPSLSIPALGCALRALLGMHEDEERRVYAKCLRVIAPGDVELIGLLAISAYRDDQFAEACLDFEAAWLRADNNFPEAWLDAWREAHHRWMEYGDDESLQRNQRYLRQARNRYRR